MAADAVSESDDEEEYSSEEEEASEASTSSESASSSDSDDGDADADVEEMEAEAAADEEDDEEDDAGEPEAAPKKKTDAERRAANVKAMLGGAVQTRTLPAVAGLRAPVVHQGGYVNKAFKGHAGKETAVSLAARKKMKLGLRGQPKPWNGRSSPLPLPFLQGMLKPEELLEEEGNGEPQPEKPKPFVPPPQPPLVLYDPAEHEDAPPGANKVMVEQWLCNWLRPHQREGVKFLYECCAGLREYKGCGCILADDMGLGKTLQGIALMYTLLKQNTAGREPMVKKAVIVCPTSLVTNWDSEIQKWLKDAPGGPPKTIAMAGHDRASADASMATFLSPMNTDGRLFKVLIVSYETFRIHSAKFHRQDQNGEEKSTQLLICDEAHRLKNGETQTNISLNKLGTRRRVLLSGTPLQNDLDEFYAMIDFTNPCVLGDQKRFRRWYQTPILNGREPDATANMRAKGEERSAELSDLVNTFILRRTNTLNAKHLPPKLMTIVCINLCQLQKDLYTHFLKSKDEQRDADKLAGGGLVKVLPYLNELRKLCNHPKICYDGVRSRLGGRKGQQSGPDKEDDVGFGADAMALFEPYQSALEAADGMKRGSSRLNPKLGKRPADDGEGSKYSWVELSGKFAVLARMLAELRRTTDDRIVVVSNFTQTLDVITSLCKDCGYPYVRLDGSISLKKRKKMVDEFCDPAANSFVFLLSSKAGGCGLNLIGGNRLILFDPDWNPAVDKQAAARVWREGQKKECFVYRFVCTGTVEEKVYQRQLSKEKLQGVVNGNDMTTDIGSGDLEDLFCPVEEDTKSTTYDLICGGEDEEKVSLSQMNYKPQEGAPLEEDLAGWAHHPTLATLPDEVMQRAGGDDVSFVFSCRVDGEFLALQAELADKKKLAEEEKAKAAAAVAEVKGAEAKSKAKGKAKRKPLGDADEAQPRDAKQRGDEGVVGSPAVESPVEPMSEDSDDEAVPNSSDVEDSGDEEEEGEEGDVEESNSESETEHESDSGSDSDFA